MAVSTSVQLTLNALETLAGDLYNAAAPHLRSVSTEWTSGTGDAAADLAFSDRRTAAAAADPIDLRGSLIGAFGNVISFVEVKLIMIVNRATTSTHILSVGAGSNPAFAGLFGATGDVIKVAAGGTLLWSAPYDGGGLITTAGTADILNIDPGANTISYDIVMLGTSA